MIFTILEILLIIFLGFVLYKTRFLLELWLKNLEKKTQHSIKRVVWEKMQNLLTVSGMGRIQSEIWWNRAWIQTVFIFLSALLAFVLFHNYQILLIPILFCLLKYYFLVKTARLRKSRILKHIPFVLDLLILNLQSGLDFIASLEELSFMNDDHPFLEEIRITLQSIQLGESRAKAFEDLSLRTDIPELAHLASVIRQSETMGSSLTDLLRLQSQEIRYRIFKQAESEAQKAPVKILIPMMLFIFPVVFIILFVPIGIQLMASFR